MEQISLQEVMDQISDSISWCNKRSGWTIRHLGAEHLACIRRGALINDSGKPVNGRVSVSTGHHVPRIRETQAMPVLDTASILCSSSVKITLGESNVG